MNPNQLAVQNIAEERARVALSGRRRREVVVFVGVGGCLALPWVGDGRIEGKEVSAAPVAAN